MNWIKLFILGLLLAMSPFQLRTEYYIFYYSIFGFGLMLIAWLFKKKDLKDWVAFAFGAVLILMGIFNYFAVFYAFIYAFSVVITLVYFVDSDEKVLSFFSLGLVGAGAVMLGLVVSNSMTIPLFGSVVLAGPVFFFSSLIGLFILDFKRLSKQ